MSFYNKRKIAHYFFKFSLDQIKPIGIIIFDSKKGYVGCITWGNIIIKDELLKTVITQCLKKGINNILSIEYCYSLQDIATFSGFHESWIYFVQQKMNLRKDSKIWLKIMQKNVLDGKSIKFLGLQDNS